MEITEVQAVVLHLPARRGIVSRRSDLELHHQNEIVGEQNGVRTLLSAWQLIFEDKMPAFGRLVPFHQLPRAALHKRDLEFPRLDLSRARALDASRTNRVSELPQQLGIIGNDEIV
jgi:hypothetical protein